MLGDQELLPTRARSKARRELEKLRTRRQDLRWKQRAAQAALERAEREATAARTAITDAESHALAFDEAGPTEGHQQRADAADEAVTAASATVARYDRAIALLDDELSSVASRNYAALAGEVERFYDAAAARMSDHLAHAEAEITNLRAARRALQELAYAAGDTGTMERLADPPRNLAAVIAHDGPWPLMYRAPEPAGPPTEPQLAPLHVWQDGQPVHRLHVSQNGQPVHQPSDGMRDGSMVLLDDEANTDGWISTPLADTTTGGPVL